VKLVLQFVIYLFVYLLLHDLYVFLLMMNILYIMVAYHNLSRYGLLTSCDVCGSLVLKGGRVFCENLGSNIMRRSILRLMGWCCVRRNATRILFSGLLSLCVGVRTCSLGLLVGFHFRSLESLARSMFFSLFINGLVTGLLWSRIWWAWRYPQWDPACDA